MSGATRKQIDAALRRWLSALNQPRRKGRLEAAVSEDVRLERQGFHAHRGQVVQVIEGLEALRAWLRSGPKATRFWLADVPEAEGEGDVWRVRYGVAVVDFLNGGLWRFRLDEQKRLRWIEHSADDLPARYLPSELPAEALSHVHSPEAHGHAHE